MRISLPSVVALALISAASGAEPKTVQSKTEVRIRVTETGKCILGSVSIDCAKVAAHLISVRFDRNSRVLLNVDDRAKVETVTAALESLQNAGFSSIMMTATNGPGSGGT
jgi:biopolymer transport protein ExbD